MPLQLHTKLRILEFIVAGLVLDLIENIISIRLTTGAHITKETFITAFLVVVPFAVLTELIIDHPRFWHKVLRIQK